MDECSDDLPINAKNLPNVGFIKKIISAQRSDSKTIKINKAYAFFILEIYNL